MKDAEEKYLNKQWKTRTAKHKTPAGQVFFFFCRKVGFENRIFRT